MMERVQVIAASLSSIGGGGGGGGELSGAEIPPEFIRSEHERPGTTTCDDGPDIPVVDLSNADQDEVSRAISDASCEWGILQLVNHGIPAEVITALQRVGRDFFELPQEEKEKYARPPGSHEGYGTSVSKDLQGKKAWSDFIFHYIWPPARINYGIWPKNPTDYRSANEEYSKWAVRLVQQILVNLSKGLALEKDALMAALGGEDLEVLLKINYYPRCPRPDLALGVVAHTDMSAITLLVPNDVQGLQVFKDERWVDVKHIPGAIIVHIGDQIEILSNGRYKSVLHRTTVNKDKVRMSWPVFCSPPQEMVIGPLPQFVSDQNPAKYKAKKYKDYSYCKLNKLPQ